MSNYPAFKGTACFQPHLVILGAGASCAAFPNGDANGTKLPLMANLAEVVGLEDLFEDHGIDIREKDFESIYDEIVTAGNNTALARELNKRIYDYFSRLELPDIPTLYDYLVLSLRGKDIIATFNWDPFLALAFQRNFHVGDLPKILFLHGNVQVGVCYEHHSKGFVWQRCNECGRALLPTELLYPVAHKNYSENPFIANEWEELRRGIQHAYILTIFGYSAPKTDSAARELMLEVWRRNQTTEFAIIEIVDLKLKTQLLETWASFRIGKNIGFFRDFRETKAFFYPRRTCDADIGARFQQKPWKENKMPNLESLAALQQWVAPLIEEERAYEAFKSPFSDTLVLTSVSP